MKGSYKIALVVAVVVLGAAVFYHWSQSGDDGAGRLSPAPASAQAQTPARPTTTPAAAPAPSSSAASSTLAAPAPTANDLFSRVEAATSGVTAAPATSTASSAASTSSPTSASPTAAPASPTASTPAPPTGFSVDLPASAMPATTAATAASTTPGTTATPATPAPAPGAPVTVTSRSSDATVRVGTNPSSATGGSGTYTIRAGDTFSSIAEQTLGSENRWIDIAQANPLVDPTKLKIGQVIKLPGAGDPASTATLGPSSGDRAASSVERPSRNERRPVEPSAQVQYVIRPGDTLSTIARQYYGDPSLWRVIYNANRSAIGSNPDRLEAGERLTIPPAPKGAR